MFKQGVAFRVTGLWLELGRVAKAKGDFGGGREEKARSVLLGSFEVLGTS